MRSMVRYIEYTIVDADDMIDDREPDTHIHLIITSSRFIYFVEFFSHESYLILGDTDTIIGEFDFDLVFFSAIATTESCSLASIFDKIREDIVKYLYEHIHIHTDIEVISCDDDLLIMSIELRSILIDELLDLCS